MTSDKREVTTDKQQGMTSDKLQAIRPAGGVVDECGLPVSVHLVVPVLRPHTAEGEEGHNNDDVRENNDIRENNDV